MGITRNEIRLILSIYHNHNIKKKPSRSLDCIHVFLNDTNNIVVANKRWEIVSIIKNWYDYLFVFHFSLNFQRFCFLNIQCPCLISCAGYLCFHGQGLFNEFEKKNQFFNGILWKHMTAGVKVFYMKDNFSFLKINIPSLLKWHVFIWKQKAISTGKSCSFNANMIRYFYGNSSFSPEHSNKISAFFNCTQRI